MPHNKQAAKRVRTSTKTKLANKDRRSAMKTQIKKVEKAIETKDSGTAAKEFLIAQQRLDKASKSRVIHPNAAARRKSRLAKKMAEARKTSG